MTGLLMHAKDSKQIGHFALWISLAARRTCSSISQGRGQKIFSPAEDLEAPKQWYPYAKRMWVEAERAEITTHSRQAMKEISQASISYPTVTKSQHSHNTTPPQPLFYDQRQFLTKRSRDSTKESVISWWKQVIKSQRDQTNVEFAF